MPTGRRVRDVGEQRAERDDRLHAERLGEVDDRVAERAPAVGRLVAGDEHEVARRAGRGRGVDLDLRPVDLAADAVDEADRRAGRLEVVELLGVDRREALRLQRAADERQRRATPRRPRRSSPRRRPPAPVREARRVGVPSATAASGPRYMMGSVALEASTDPRGACAPVRRSTSCWRARARSASSARSGSPYLALEFRDRVGRDRAAARSGTPTSLAGRFERGDLVRVRGARRALPRRAVARRRRRSAARRDADPAAFLPVAYRDLDELDGFLEHLDPRGPRHRPARLAARACSPTPRCAPSSGARRARAAGHHAYLGGLLEHTVAVGTLALETCVLHPRLNSDVLVTAALLHDLGKTREFTYGAEIGISDEGRLRRPRRVRRAADLEARAGGVPDAKRLAVVHCVLTHHGDGALPVRRRRSRCTGSTRSRAPSRAPSSTVCTSVSGPPSSPGTSRPRAIALRRAARSVGISGADSSRSNAYSAAHVRGALAQLAVALAADVVDRVAGLVVVRVERRRSGCRRRSSTPPGSSRPRRPRTGRPRGCRRR